MCKLHNKNQTQTRARADEKQKSPRIWGFLEGFGLVNEKEACFGFGFGFDRCSSSKKSVSTI